MACNKLYSQRTSHFCFISAMKHSLNFKAVVLILVVIYSGFCPCILCSIYYKTPNQLNLSLWVLLQEIKYFLIKFHTASTTHLQKTSFCKTWEDLKKENATRKCVLLILLLLYIVCSSQCPLWLESLNYSFQFPYVCLLSKHDRRLNYLINIIYPSLFFFFPTSDWVTIGKSKQLQIQ